MNRITKIIAVAAALLALGTAQAQYKYGGAMMDHDGVMSSDIFSLTQQNFGFGTARSMGMAGAFTSLGADMASMSLNPAGLGMYRSNDFSFSPLMGFQSADNSAVNWGDNKQSRFAVSNLGIALNIYESSSTRLTSLTLGLGYNRIADFNYRYGFSSKSEPSVAPLRSIADVFALMMGQSGLFPEGDNFLPSDDYRYAYYWGGILAYNGELLDVGEDEFGKFYTTADRIGANAGIGHTVQMQSRGSIGEYDIALGMNFDSKLYVGFTVGIQSVNWKQQMYYGEDYLYDGATPVYADGTPLARPAKWMDYGQSVKLSGSGINFKAGVVYRPVEALRLGMAIHTPTYYALERSYQASMATNFYAGETTPSLDDYGENTWDFSSPTRLMFGASYAFGRFAVVSVDYERDWYNGIRMKNIPAGFDLGKDDYRREFKSNYKGSNIVRVGAEIKPVPMLALRAGYGVAAGALREDKSLYFNAPQTYKTTCISAGVGVALGSTTIDLAYQNILSKQTGYMLFYAMDEAGIFDTASPIYRTDLSRNYFTLTIGYRF